MTLPIRFTALADRVQALTSACRETDALIAMAVGFPGNAIGGGFAKSVADYPSQLSDVARWHAVPAYTASLDAAMTLVPEGHAFSFRRNCSQDGEIVYCNAQVWPYSSPREDVPHHWANSPEDAPAIALTAAILRARAALENSNG